MLNSFPYRVNIAQLGERVVWYKAMPTDARNANTGYASADDRGDDHGRKFILQGERKALIMGLKREQEHSDYGWIPAGTLTLTADPDVMWILPFDKVSLRNRVTVARAILQRGGTASSTVAPDTIPHLDVTRVRLVSDNDVAYCMGADYTFNATTRVISWTAGGNAPAIGANYAIEYEHHEEYWFLGMGQSEPRPLSPDGRGLSPIRGLLMLKPPKVP